MDRGSPSVMFMTSSPSNPQANQSHIPCHWKNLELTKSTSTKAGNLQAECSMKLCWTTTVRYISLHFKQKNTNFCNLDQPHNPMVNSGAIMSASILLHSVKKEMNMAQKYDYVFAFFKVSVFTRYYLEV